MKRWPVKAMSKTEIGCAYAPFLQPHSAVKRLMQWISINPTLTTALQATGYHKNQKMLTARQVALIFEHLGEALHGHPDNQAQGAAQEHHRHQENQRQAEALDQAHDHGKQEEIGRAHV